LSLQAKILSLVAGIDDPWIRNGVASTIHYLFGVYSAGGVPEGKVRDALVDVCRDVIAYLHPELSKEEVEKNAATMADELMRVFRVEALSRRIMSRFRPPSLPI